MASCSREQKHKKNLVRCYKPWSPDFQAVHIRHPKTLISHVSLEMRYLDLGFINFILCMLLFILSCADKGKDDLRYLLDP